MILAFVLFVAFAAVIYLHTTQGFFSATLSAIIAVFSAVIAFSLHEWIGESFMAGKGFDNVVNTIALVISFAITYTLLRIIFDKFVPEGVTLPSMVDKLGSIVMGAIAAAYGVGIVAVAAQELPFGSNVAGFTRYEAQARSVSMATGNSVQNATGANDDELRSNEVGHFVEADRKSTLFFDDLVVKTVSYLSTRGSLSGRSIASIHPDFLQELYAQNIGIQGGASHVFLNQAAEGGVKSPDLYALGGDVHLSDAYLAPVHEASGLKIPLPRSLFVKDASIKANFTFDDNASKSMIMLVARLNLGKSVADPGSPFIRFSPGSVRLVARKSGSNPQDAEFVNYYPIGVTEPNVNKVQFLYVQKPDDYLIAPLPAAQQAVIDFVFAIDKSAVIDKSNKVLDGTFLEFKRMTRFDLTGDTVHPFFPQDGGKILKQRKSGVPADEDLVKPLAPTSAPVVAP